MTQSTPLLCHTIPLSVPAGDGETEHVQLILHRPKTRHIRRLACLFGPDLVKALFSGDGSLGEMIEKKGSNLSDSTFADMLAGFLAEDKLTEVTAVVADLCKVDPSIIDDVDPVDWPKIGDGLRLFFPGLSEMWKTSG